MDQAQLGFEVPQFNLGTVQPGSEFAQAVLLEPLLNFVQTQPVFQPGVDESAFLASEPRDEF